MDALPYWIIIVQFAETQAPSEISMAGGFAFSDEIVLISSGLVWPVLQPAPKHGRILSLKLGRPETELKAVHHVNGKGTILS